MLHKEDIMPVGITIMKMINIYVASASRLGTFCSIVNEGLIYKNCCLQQDSE